MIKTKQKTIDLMNGKEENNGWRHFTLWLIIFFLVLIALYQINNRPDYNPIKVINSQNNQKIKVIDTIDNRTIKTSVEFKLGSFTAYTASADECGNDKGITASGKKVKESYTLACPREYKFGTKVFIEGVGERYCTDRGGAIKGNKFDIYVKTKSEAFAFGIRNLNFYIN